MGDLRNRFIVCISMCVIRWTNVSDGVCSYVCPVLTGVEWFGVDIGGTLTKGVYFECHTQSDKNKGEGVRVLQNFVKSNLTYGSSGNRYVIVSVHVCLPVGVDGVLVFVHVGVGVGVGVVCVGVGVGVGVGVVCVGVGVGVGVGVVCVGRCIYSSM